MVGTESSTRLCPSCSGWLRTSSTASHSCSYLTSTQAGKSMKDLLALIKYSSVFFEIVTFSELRKTCDLFGLFLGMGKSEKINIFQYFGKIFRIIIENIIFIDIEMQGKNYALRQNLQPVLL